MFKFKTSNDDIISWDLNRSHFSFLENYEYDGTPIELMEVCTKDVVNGLILYEKYKEFQMNIVPILNEFSAEECENFVFSGKVQNSNYLQKLSFCERAKVLVELESIKLYKTNAFLNFLDFNLPTYDELCLFDWLNNNPTEKTMIDSIMCYNYYFNLYALARWDIPYMLELSLNNNHIRVYEYFLHAFMKKNKPKATEITHVRILEAVNFGQGVSELFHDAIMSQKINVTQLINQIYTEYAGCLIIKNEYLFWSVIAGNLEVFDYLLSNEFVESVNNTHSIWGHTLSSVDLPKCTVLQSLINKNPNTNMCKMNLFTFACIYNRYDMAKRIIAFGLKHGKTVDIHSTGTNCENLAMLYACEMKQIDNVKWLLSLETLDSPYPLGVKEPAIKLLKDVEST